MSEISFSDLMKQADEIAETTKQYTRIGVSYTHYGSGTKELLYELYQPDFNNTEQFSSVQELQQAMDNIINPPEDKGVKV